MNISERFKNYEQASKYYLPNRLPVIIRLDGKSFSNLTKNLEKPFDSNFVDVMQNVAIYCCENIQNSKIAFVASDEISILMNSYSSHETQAWVNNSLSKILSISAAFASSKFTELSGKIFRQIKACQFDSRAFVLPLNDVNNYFLYRQQDITRNSISMLARSLYSDKECFGKNKNDLQEMTFAKGKNWNDLPSHLKRGACAVYSEKWKINKEIPIFSEDVTFIEQFL